MLPAPDGAKLVWVVSAMPGRIEPTPPVPEPVMPVMRLDRSDVPTPGFRGNLFRSGVGRGTSIFAGASRSKAT